MKKNLISTMKLLTSFAYIFGAAFLIAGLVLGAFVQPASASNLCYHCGDVMKSADAPGDLVVFTLPSEAPSNEYIGWVMVKSGADDFGNQRYELTSDGVISTTFKGITEPCYKVTGIGTRSVTVERLNIDDVCKAISHIEYRLDCHSETPTATHTDVPTATATATFTDEPTDEPTATATFTDEPTDEPTATATFTDEPTATATSTEEPTATATKPGVDPRTPTPTSTVQIPGVTPTATSTIVVPPGVTPTATKQPTTAPTATTVATLPPPSSTGTTTPALIPVTGLDISGSLGVKSVLMNLGFALLGLAFVCHGLYLKLSHS